MGPVRGLVPGLRYNVLAFSVRLVRPYTSWLVIVIIAMLVETATSLASPWPLKIVLDSVIDGRPIPASWQWLTGGPPDRATAGR
jgi:ABC-type multidrug transport system fused ATPase/permease subunit